MLGSSLAAIAIFLSIEPYFGSFTNLGIALSIKTATGVVLSMFSGRINASIGTKKALILSQIFGLLSVSVLIFGFHQRDFLITMVGMVLSSIPSTFLQINLTSGLKFLTKSDEEFRKASNHREMIAAGALLVAAFAVPILLDHMSLFAFFVFDAATFILGLAIFSFVVIAKAPTSAPQKVALLSIQALKHADGRIYLVGCMGALCLMAILPLAASSESFDMTRNMPELLRESFWGVEALTGLFGGWLYAHIIRSKFFNGFKVFSLFNAIFLALGVLIPTALFGSAIFPLLVAAATLMRLAAFSLRDDLMLRAESSAELIHEYSAYSHLIRQFVGSLSPLVLVALFEGVELKWAVAIIVAWQLTLGITYLTMNRSRGLQSLENKSRE
jgi:MFS family permease